MTSMTTLERECDEAIRYRFTEIINECGNVRDISDEDVLDAATYGERPFLDGSDMPATECADRAWERACAMKVRLIEAQDTGTLSSQLTHLIG